MGLLLAMMQQTGICAVDCGCGKSAPCMSSLLILIAIHALFLFHHFSNCYKTHEPYYFPTIKIDLDTPNSFHGIGCWATYVMSVASDRLVRKEETPHFFMSLLIKKITMNRYPQQKQKTQKHNPTYPLLPTTTRTTTSKLQNPKNPHTPWRPLQ